MPCESLGEEEIVAGPPYVGDRGVAQGMDGVEVGRTPLPAASA